VVSSEETMTREDNVPDTVKCSVKTRTVSPMFNSHGDGGIGGGDYDDKFECAHHE
jgi:hypothetical protein